MTSIATPFISGVMKVEKDWIDYNGHMNMAYYNVLFDRCSDKALELIGIGAAYARERRLTTYVAEVHVCYVRELHLDDAVTVTFQLIDHDEKRLHVYQEVHHVDGWLAATAESLSLHIDMSGPKVAPFPPDIAARIVQMQAAHTALPVLSGQDDPSASGKNGLPEPETYCSRATAWHSVDVTGR